MLGTEDIASVAFVGNGYKFMPGNFPSSWNNFIKFIIKHMIKQEIAVIPKRARYLSF